MEQSELNFNPFHDYEQFNINHNEKYLEINSKKNSPQKKQYIKNFHINKTKPNFPKNSAQTYFKNKFSPTVSILNLIKKAKLNDETSIKIIYYLINNINDQNKKQGLLSSLTT